MDLSVEKISRIVIRIDIRFIESGIVLTDKLVQIIVVTSEFFTVALGYRG